MTLRDRVLVFDFDGTVSLGLGPVRSYARYIAQGLPIDEAHAFLAAVDGGLARPSGILVTEARADFIGTAQTVNGTPPIDGYDLVRLLSLQFPVTAADRDAAYLQSRFELATDAAPVIAPLGLADFLAKAREHAHLVLATNAPDIRLNEALDALGLAGAFDAIHPSVGKPGGLDAILDTWLDRVGAGPSTASERRVSPAHALLSIGDVWLNDLAPAHRRGASTALVGDSPAPDATPTFQAEQLPELYPALCAWLTAPAVVPAVAAP